MPVVAVDIGGTQYRLAVVSREGEILLHQRARTNREAGAKWLLPSLRAELRELLAKGAHSPQAIGIGFGGPVDFASQTILASLHAPGWEEVDLCGELEREFALPCVIDNDANMGGLGEYTYGAGRGFGSILYYTVCTGGGGGVIIGG